MTFTPFSFNIHSNSTCSSTLDLQWEKKQLKKKKIQNEKKKYSEMQASTSCAYSVIHLIIVQLECCTIIWDHLEKCKQPSIQWSIQEMY